MRFQPNNVYHVFNEGNNKERIFLCEKDYQTFLNFTVSLILPFSDILSYCLMPNHFHFQVCPNEACNDWVKQGGLYIDSLTNGIRKLLSGYARVFNNKYGRSGSLFRQKTQATCLTFPENSKANPLLANHCPTCFYYIHDIPVVARLVSKPEDWRWSSYADYAGLTDSSICNKGLAYQFCANNTPEFWLQAPGIEELRKFAAGLDRGF